MNDVWVGVLICLLWAVGLLYMFTRPTWPAEAVDALVSALIWLGTAVTPSARARQARRELERSEQRRGLDAVKVDRWLADVLQPADRSWLLRQTEVLPERWAILGAREDDDQAVLTYRDGRLQYSAPPLPPCGLASCTEYHGRNWPQGMPHRGPGASGSSSGRALRVYTSPPPPPPNAADQRDRQLRALVDRAVRRVVDPSGEVWETPDGVRRFVSGRGGRTALYAELKRQADELASRARQQLPAMPRGGGGVVSVRSVRVAAVREAWVRHGRSPRGEYGGRPVREWQAAHRVPVDGFWGPQCERAHQQSDPYRGLPTRTHWS